MKELDDEIISKIDEYYMRSIFNIARTAAKKEYKENMSEYDLFRILVLSIAAFMCMLLEQDRIILKRKSTGG